ncbi:hypothetical protein [Chromobacterium phragmitis]|uniref:hypothetical protein n=1 Tax=Chromobacterium phragmitis TaxID=2202141 RepID=UPI0011AE9E16|nr:hypothetical protein [Chromobacterium phragmitis]
MEISPQIASIIQTSITSLVNALVFAGGFFVSRALEKHKVNNQLKTAAFDARLQAHQEAYGLWRRMNSTPNDEQAYSIVKECDEWWNNNCLYLEPDARVAFLSAFISKRQLANYKGDDYPLMSHLRNQIESAGNKIVTAISLPIINEQEIIDNKKSNK